MNFLAFRKFKQRFHIQLNEEAVEISWQHLFCYPCEQSAPNGLLPNVHIRTRTNVRCDWSKKRLNSTWFLFEKLQCDNVLLWNTFE